MIRAYSELYLNDAQKLLANAFDYALNDCKFNTVFFASVFVKSKQCKEFERGNPSVISGMAGEEVVREIVKEIMPDKTLPKSTFSQERSPEYWAGWALAYYQWITAKRFKDIFARVPLLDVLKMYKLYHEMDLSNFVEEMDRRYNAVQIETKLKIIREARQISQAELARLSGVKKRSIQLYEQKVNDIDKAQAQTLYKISRVLGCNIEDLLETPESV